MFEGNSYTFNILPTIYSSFFLHFKTGNVFKIVKCETKILFSKCKQLSLKLGFTNLFFPVYSRFKQPYCRSLIFEDHLTLKLLSEKGVQ